MKLIKKLNNNYALALDSKGREVIASGKGIGFIKMPCQLNDMNRIDHVFYDLDDRFKKVLSSVSTSMLEVSDYIFDLAQRELKVRLNPNLIFVLADHLQFALKRVQRGIIFDIGISYEISYLHPREMEIGKKSLNYINTHSKIKLPESEAAILAMHILENEPMYKSKKDPKLDDIVDQSLKIIEDVYQIYIDKNSFSYYRFATHIKYLLDRKMENKSINSDNRNIMEQMINEFPNAYKCVQILKQYLKEEMNWSISEEEQLYLMLHINRMKEDCNQKRA